MARARKNLKIALSGFGGLDNPAPGIGVARALRAKYADSVELHGLVYDPWETGALVPGLLNRIHLMPALSTSDHLTAQRLESLHEEFTFDFFLPNQDLEIPVYSRLSPRLRRAGIKHILPSPESLAAASKVYLASTCYRNDIRIPATIHALDVEDVPRFAEQIGFPIVVKSTVAGAKVVPNSLQALVQARRYNEQWGGGAILQEYIRGEEFVVAFTAGRNGKTSGAVPMRKTGINSIGKAVSGVVVDDPALVSLTRDIVKALKWEGPGELEFIRSKDNGEFYCFELNCRFPSWIYLSHFAGVNLPADLVEAGVTGKKPRKSTPRPGAGFTRDVQEFSLDLNQVRKFQRFGDLELPKARIGTPHRQRDQDGLAVAVSGVSAFSQSGAVDTVLPGLGTARSLRDAPEVSRVHGIAYGLNDTGVHRAGFLDSAHFIQGFYDSDLVLERLSQIRKKVGLDLYIPTTDAELACLLEIRAELEGEGIQVVLPTKKAFQARTKASLFKERLLPQGDVLRIPVTHRIRSQKSLSSARDLLGEKIVLKGKTGGAEVAVGKKQLDAAWSILKDKGEDVIYAQDFIEGAEYSIIGHCDAAGDVRASFTVKKICRTSQFKTWGAIVVDELRVLDHLSRYLKSIRWQGPFELEFIKDQLTDNAYLVEINPRYGAFVDFARLAGFNLPRDFVRCLLDKPKCEGKLRSDELLFRTAEEYAVDAMQIAAFAAKGSIVHEA